jgi:glycosyltransferase involved in cell wall biosynthesis
VKILLVHNEYGKFSGEEVVVENLSQLLNENGHEVVYFRRSSAEIPQMFLGNTRAFLNGIYSFSSRNTMRQYLRRHKPDIVHVHNVFPLISPSVFGQCRQAGIPVVMTVHNYRLACPSGLHMVADQVCEKCRNGREYWCVINNCEAHLLKSLGYALRNYVARKLRLFKSSVTIYACITQFQKQRLIAEGFSEQRLAVLPNFAGKVDANGPNGLGSYVGFIGRVSSEKGVETLLQAAEMLPDVSFKAAGAYEKMPDLLKKATGNFEFLGAISRVNVSRFYSRSRLIVVPSIWFEGFPNVIVEAMMHGKPVIASRIGGIPEIVADDAGILLFEPGDAGDLVEKIQYLWDRPQLCQKIGQTFREKAVREYSVEKYYRRLMGIYEKAIELGPGGPPGLW